MSLILLVEDEEMLREVVAESLTSLGFEVVSAANAADGLESFKRQTPDLVLSDIRMPGGDGVSLLESIRKSSKIPVVLMTGFSDLTDAECRARGASAVLHKPFNQAALESVLRGLVPLA